MKKRNCMGAIWCLCLLGMLAVSWACSPTMDSQPSHKSKTTEGNMNLAYKIESEAPTIPAIDAAAPSVFETASFGLG
jgi:hypothetical protein